MQEFQNAKANFAMYSRGHMFCGQLKDMEIFHEMKFHKTKLNIKSTITKYHRQSSTRINYIDASINI